MKLGWEKYDFCIAVAKPPDQSRLPEARRCAPGQVMVSGYWLVTDVDKRNSRYRSTPFGLHRDWNPRKSSQSWTITHGPTGQALMAGIKGFDNAKRIAYSFALGSFGAVDWRSRTTSDVVKPRLSAFVREIKEIGDTSWTQAADKAAQITGTQGAPTVTEQQLDLLWPGEGSFLGKEPRARKTKKTKAPAKPTAPVLFLRESHRVPLLELKLEGTWGENAIDAWRSGEGMYAVRSKLPLYLHAPSRTIRAPQSNTVFWTGVVDDLEHWAYVGREESDEPIGAKWARSHKALTARAKAIRREVPEIRLLAKKSSPAKKSSSSSPAKKRPTERARVKKKSTPGEWNPNKHAFVIETPDCGVRRPTGGSASDARKIARSMRTNDKPARVRSAKTGRYV